MNPISTSTSSPSQLPASVLEKKPSMEQVQSDPVAIDLREAAHTLSNELKLPEDLSHTIRSSLPGPLDEAQQAVNEAKDALRSLVDLNLDPAERKKLAQPLLEKLAAAEKRLQWETAVTNLKTSIDTKVKPEKIALDFLNLLFLRPDVAAAPQDRELQKRATVPTLRSLGLELEEEKEILRAVRPDLSEAAIENLLSS